MLAAQPIEHLPCGLRATSFHIGQPALNSLDRLDAVEQSLVGLRVLHDELRFPVDGQDQGMASLPKTIEQLDRVAFEVAERPNIVGQIHLHEHFRKQRGDGDPRLDRRLWR